MTIEDRLCELVEWAASEERRVLEPFAKAGPKAGEWSVEDTLWHTAAWRRHMAKTLRTLYAGEPPDDLGSNVDARNAEVLAAGRQESAEGVRAESDASVADLIAAISQAPVGFLERRLEGEWRAGEQAWQAVVGNSCEHVLIHLWPWLIESGRSSEAIDLHNKAGALMDALPPSTVLDEHRYDLACLYCLSGEPDRAMPELAAAIAGFSALREGALTDSDLDPLRGRREFEELLRA